MRKPSQCIKRSVAHHRWILVIFAILAYACTDADQESSGTVHAGATEEKKIFQAETSKTPLPEDIQWLTRACGID